MPTKLKIFEFVPPFDDWEQTDLIKELEPFAEEHNIDRIWYWYGTGNYEGSGYALVRFRDEIWTQRYALVCLDHCSCNGPLDNRLRALNDRRRSTYLYAACSAELKKSVKELFDAALKEDKRC
jgi:hypothetical protein